MLIMQIKMHSFLLIYQLNDLLKNTIIVLTMMVRILFQVFHQIHLLHHIKLYFILISLFSLLRRKLWLFFKQVN